MTPVEWLAEAEEDVIRLHEFLAGVNSDAADRAVRTILAGVALLETVPEAGRPMPDGTGSRELVVSFGAGAYVLRYRLYTSDLAVIIRVWHSRENRHI